MGYRVSLVPLRELRPHEDTNKARAYSLALDILRRRVLFRPIIVEEKSLTIIDGHHRLNALRLIGARLAPVVLASYDKDIVSIGARPRIVRLGLPAYKALDFVAAAIENNSRRAHTEIAVTLNGETITVRRDPLDANRTLKEILASKKVGEHGKTTQITLRIPPLSPRHVLRASYEEETMPARTTLHKTPLKKMFYPVKLNMLL
ncbi:MAG: ParB N-terminal domain-containing protein [Pyrodictiaceae archaeon]